MKISKTFQQQWLSLEQLHNSNFWRTADVSNCFKTISRLGRIGFPWNSTKGAIRWQPYAFRPSRVWEVTFRHFRDHRRQILWENAIMKQLLRSWARNDLMWNHYTLNNLTDTLWKRNVLAKHLLFSEIHCIKTFKLLDMKASDLLCFIVKNIYRYTLNTKRCCPIGPTRHQHLFHLDWWKKLLSIVENVVTFLLVIGSRDMAIFWQNDILKNVLKWIGRHKFHRLSCCLDAFIFISVFRILILRENWP